MQPSRRSGFTLLEMSIVLLIIGVIVGGILVGRNVLISSRLQSVITDVDTYTSAVASFKQTYLSVPGDMGTATTNWGTDNLGCPTGGGVSGTCNGDNNGQIAGETSYEYESFRFWQHLSLGGFFNKPVTGVAGSAGVYDSIPGTNVPTGSFEGGGYSAIWWGTVGTESSRFPGFYGNILLYGRRSSGAITNGAILTPDQAAGIDAKMDDGLPATGKVRAYMSGSAINSACSTTAVVSTAAYNVSVATPQCSLIFVMGF